MKTAYLKHSFSCLPDVNFETDVDEDRRLFTVTAARFDSQLFCDLVVMVLPDQWGVITYRGDDASWIPPPARYRLLARFCGQEFEATMVKLLEALGPSRVAVSLDQ